jgi:hypothetical protein
MVLIRHRLTGDANHANAQVQGQCNLPAAVSLPEHRGSRRRIAGLPRRQGPPPWA